MQQLNMQLADRMAGGGPLGQGLGVERDHLGRTRSKARKDYLCFTRDRPTFERGRDHWNDFANRFQGAMRDHGMTEEQAKWVLYNAIVGQSSRLVISSMNPEGAAVQHMEFREYLRRMGEKFTPATESIQMEAEYRSRKQGKNENVQNYINAKYDLFQLAFPNAQERDRRGVHQQVSEGPDVLFRRQQHRSLRSQSSKRGPDQAAKDLDRRQQYQQDGWADSRQPADQRRQA